MEQMDEISSVYKTPHIAVTMGGDFHYQAAGASFLNLDALIKYLLLIVLFARDLYKVRM